MIFRWTSNTSLWHLLVTALATRSALASPLDLSQANSIDKRQTPAFAVTGLAGPGESLQQRLEVRDLQKNADQWNIYLLGMQRLQAMDQNDMLSHFQMAGIHGMPFIPWDGVKGTGNPNAGYCTHSSNLFLTWHRPYLALYENILVSHARDAAQEFPKGEQRNRYVAAAQNLRMPYWDWAKKAPQGQHTMPDSMVKAQVTVISPNGSQTIANPLYSYTFHPRRADTWAPWPQTIRHPRNVNDASTTDDTNGLVTQLDREQSQYAPRLFNLFANYNSYPNVSNEAWYKGQTDMSKYDSFESVHDAIHSAVGGAYPNGGQMTYITTSAFDPAFWLHHTNIDRLSAMWQGLNPNSYVAPTKQIGNSYWYNINDVLDANTPLKPFYANSKGTFHTSNTVRDWTKFGYTYPEVASKDPAVIRHAVNVLYGSTASSSTRSFKKRASTVDYETPENPRDYIVNIRADRMGSTGPYGVRVFLGDFVPNPVGWGNDPNLVGTLSVLAQTTNSTPTDVLLVSGVVLLKQRLQEDFKQGKLAGLTQDAVVPYLKQNLHWRIQKLDGCEIPRDSMPDLKISVVSSEVKPAASLYELSQWVNGFTLHSDITDGRPAGLSNGDNY